MTSAPKGRIGDRLVAKGLIQEKELNVALKEQRRAHRPLGQILASLGFIRAEHLAELQAEDLDLPFVRARDLEPDEVLLSALDPSFVRTSGAFPLRLDEGKLQVAMVDPGDPEKVAQVRERFPYPLDLLVLTEPDLDILLRTHLLGRQGELENLLSGREEAAQTEEFPVERVARALIVDAVHRNATDIHVEPEEKVTRMRYRIDGILEQAENLPREHTDAIISRLKVMSRLDIAERRRPQDGRIRIEIDGRNVDIRVSIMPCTNGENVVLRVLDQSGGALRLAQIGVPADQQHILAHIADRPHGLFLVTGPTGSGKTTTLYSMLAEVDALHRNVATIEDPVEYRMPLLRQSQVDTSIGFTFNEGLRSLLRQDPDVILVGEIRDGETARMAIRASMTGHLVFSTLHTNTALGAVSRLGDLGIDQFLIEDALVGVLAQRLVRRVCDACGNEYELSDSERAWLGDDVGHPRRGAGCGHCNGTGLAGRTVISELFLPNDEIAEAIRSGAPVGDLNRMAVEAGYKNMSETGKQKVRLGETTMEEIQRVNRSHRLSTDELEEL